MIQTFAIGFADVCWVSVFLCCKVFSTIFLQKIVLLWINQIHKNALYSARWAAQGSDWLDILLQKNAWSMNGFCRLC